jgi:hypothetical protein
MLSKGETQIFIENKEKELLKRKLSSYGEEYSRYMS